MKPLLTFLATLLCTSLFAVGAPPEDFPDISIDDLEEFIETGEVILVDVNGSRYFAKGHIPGAIDFRAHEEKITEVLSDDKSQLIVVYCGGPSCSAYETAAFVIREAGYTNIRHLSAGISGWIGAEKETARLDR